MPWRSHGWRWPVWQESRLSRARPWRTTWTRFLPGIPHSRRRTSCWQRCWQALCWGSCSWSWRRYDERALERALVVLAAPALVAGTVVLALHQESLSAIANNEFAASTLAPSYPAVIGAHLIVGAIALAIAGLSMKRVQSRRTTLALRATASLLALAAVFVTRIVFYHLHMTVGF